MLKSFFHNLQIKNLFKLSFFIEILGGFYLDYVFAFLIQKNGFIPSLFFVGLFFTFGLLGCFLAFYLMKNPSIDYGKTSQFGFLLLGIFLILPFIFQKYSFFIFSLGGIGFGMIWTERQWIESQHLLEQYLDSYLSFLQSIITITNVLLGFSLSFLLQYYFSTQTIFYFFSSLFFLVFFLNFNSSYPHTHPYQIHFNFLHFSFWKNNLFFLIDGATSMLKINLFIMANIFIFHSIAHYAFLNSISLIVSSFSLFFIAKKITIQHRNIKYLLGLFLTIIGWIFFIFSLIDYSISYFLVFIVFYSIGSPIVSSSRHSIVILGFKTQENTIEGNTILREILLTISRIITIIFSIFILQLLPTNQSIALLAFILIFLLIIEYISAQLLLLKKVKNS
jgi:hypothetical protein